MMSLSLKSPTIEVRIRELAARSGVDPETYLEELVSVHLAEDTPEGRRPTATGASKRPFYETTTAEEWKEALDRWAARFPRDAPLLSDEALRRENMYEDRGL
ncbi:MAG TPA: hypothetical protein VFJ58_00270 [Armatimonadota bacterium]|nr:hypothetical protein [Armatimonadota bacterium]